MTTRHPSGHTVPVAATIDRLVPWTLRAAWVAAGLTVADLLDGLEGSDGSAWTWLQIGLAVAWIVGAIAATFPAVRSLTIVRALFPLTVPVTIAGWIGGGGADSVAFALAASLVAATLAGTAEFGRDCVQASAYGAEDRHLLRPPPAYLAAAVISWLLAASAVTAGGSLLASGDALVGGALLTGGAAFAVWASPRWHRLSRRWLVIVPAGVVVHDHLVLAETLMVTRSELAGVVLAPAGTTAADLTGPAGGHALEISTRAPVTAVLAATPTHPGGRAIHLTAALVAPSRPGAAMRAIDRRRSPGPPVTR